MDKSLYVAMTGAHAALQAQGTVAQNLANVDTAGFKAVLSNTESFKIKGDGFPSRIDAVLTDAGFDARPGARRTTGNALDIALDNHHWLQVTAPDGTPAYTRAGELAVTAEGQLVTHSGHPVLDDGGQPVSIPPHQSLEIGSDGTVSIIPLGENAATRAVVARLGIVEAPPTRLARGLDGLMRDNQPEAAPLAQASGHALTSGMLEGSNVDPAGALVQMIQLQRQFEMQVKFIQHGDDNAQSANTLLRLSG